MEGSCDARDPPRARLAPGGAHGGPGRGDLAARGPGGRGRHDSPGATAQQVGRGVRPTGGLDLRKDRLMVPHPRIGPLTLDRLGPADLPEVFGWLDADPILNVYLMALVLRDALAAPRDEYWAVRREARIAAFLHVGGQSGAVLPLGEDMPALRLIADQARRRVPFLPRRFQAIGP